VAILSKDRKVLWARARNRCAFPQCRQALTVDQVDAATGEDFPTVIGEEAHIRSAWAGGPRHDPTYPREKLDAYENYILLCPVHHSMIDAERGRGYDVDTLLRMRSDHEQREERSARISQVIRAYIGGQYAVDDKVLFEQVDLRGPSVDAMFVDVPFGCRRDATPAGLMARIAADHPGDIEAADGYVVTGAAQALLHPDWSSNALLVGGPGQGKSTLLQYVCQFHRARRLNRDGYTGEQQRLSPLTTVTRIPVRLDLRRYAEWASSRDRPGTPKGHGRTQRSTQPWPSLEEYIVAQVTQRSGGRKFTIEDLGVLVSTEPVLLALDGLDEVANLKHREQVSEEIVQTHARLQADALDLVVLVATRPGATTSALWSSQDFPVLNLQRLTQGLRVQYLRRWCVVARLSDGATDKLQQTFLENQRIPHIRELASYPMQLAILLHLLHRRQLLPQQRTELYREYLKTFLDREQTQDKEPLLSDQRKVIEDIHAFLGWYLQTRAEEGGAGRIGRDELQKSLHEQLAGWEKGQELAKMLFSAFSSRVLCLLERETGFYEFEVQSLREYFAALYIFDNAPTKGQGNSRDDCLTALLERPYWSNVCRFFVGMFSSVEVRGIRHNLRGLSTKPTLRTHPLLRSMAALLLDDWTFQGQPDEPIQEIVDFILDGPGVVLAEDGLLDVSGSPLLLTEGAGRKQVIRHMQKRLPNTASAGLRQVMARCLRRHANADDDLAAWWWTQFDSSLPWLETAAHLGALRGANSQQASDLADALTEVRSESLWMTDLLVRGGYDGNADEVLAICVEEINDGAADVVDRPGAPTPLSRLFECASLAQLRPARNPSTSSEIPHGGTRTRFRRTKGQTLVADIVAGMEALRSRPNVSADVQLWRERLAQVAKIWGDGWVLRQAVAMVPSDLDLTGLAASAAADSPELGNVLETEAGARANKGNADWWRQSLRSAATELDRRHWAFSVLAIAHTQVVIDLAPELNDVVDSIEPRHARVITAALTAFRKSSLVRTLVIQDSLRRNQVNYSPRTLWLLRFVATESGTEQVDKKLLARFEELLQPGMGDMRPLLRTVGASKTIKIDALRGTRSVLPAGGWASDVKLGAIRPTKADEILKEPAEWPSDIVQRAVEQTAEPIAGAIPVSSLATANKWFQDT
jgi:hypothetical protein